MKDKNQHARLPQLLEQLQQKKMGRREFVRFAALLGVSATTAAQMAGMVWPRKVFAATPKRGGTL